MREGVIINAIQSLDRKISQVDQYTKVGVSGEIVRNQALTNLLIEKGYFTQEELNAAIGKVIQEVNTPKQEEAAAPAPEIVPATPEQVAEVQKSVEETK